MKRDGTGGRAGAGTHSFSRIRRKSRKRRVRGLPPADPVPHAGAVRTAFKEWAIVVDALGRGRQSVILRKGGIAEGRGGFRPEHAR